MKRFILLFLIFSIFNIYSQKKFNLDSYFINAVKNNNFNQTREAIYGGANLKTKDFNGNNALNIAIFNENIPIIELLLENKIVVNSKNNQGQTSFMLALARGNREIIEIFKNIGVNTDSRDLEFNNLLHFAVMGNNLEIVKQIIDKKNVNLSNIDGVTPLLNACKIKNIDISIIETLIEYGADIKHRDKNGRFPLLEAASIGNIDVVKILLKNNSFDNSSINKKALNGNSPLLEAVLSNNYELVSFLIDNGADVNIKNSLGVTPLIIAAGINYDTTKLLIKNGAKLKPKARFDSPYSIMGGDALFSAANNNIKENVKLLIESGANINTKSYLGSTPLLEALRHNNEELFYYIKKNGGNISAKNSYGRNGLFFTVENNNYELTKNLLENGVDIKYDYIAETPYSIAYKNNYSDIVELILSYEMKR